MGADYIAQYMREELYSIFLNNAKVPYTDAGFALIASGVFAALNRATDLGIIATDPESDAGVFTVTVPKRADATDDEARARKMPDIVWEAQLEGAVHSVKVKGHAPRHTQRVTDERRNRQCPKKSPPTTP